MKHGKKEKQPMPYFLFTLETIRLTEEAIKLFELPLQQASHQGPKVRFAAETIRQVKEKLERMKNAVGLAGLTSFDFNEKIIVVYALRLYSFVLASSPVSAQQAELIRQCLHIATSFEADNTAIEAGNSSN